jgi:alginate O-acetyltransferase complex protein AlgI
MLALRDRLEIQSWCQVATWLFFGTSKAATLLRLGKTIPGQWTAGKLIAYLLWPGMQPRPFLQPSVPAVGISSLWATGAINLLTGSFLLWVVPHVFPTEMSLLGRLCVGIIGYAFFVLFGIFDLAAALYRQCGVPVDKLWDNPLAATSLADFWGNRWNRIFSGFARDMLVAPLARRLSPRGVGLVVFLFSGLLHEYAWSFPANGGYGGPLSYFLVQWLGFQVEGSRRGRRLFRGRPSTRGRLWTWMIVLLPLPLLFPSTFLRHVVLPLLINLGVSGL